MEQPKRANVLGVALTATNLEEATERVIKASTAGRKGYVCVTGVHGVSEAQKDAAFRSILNDAFLNVPDGMPMSWVGWLQGHSTMDRVYGPDLMLAVSDAGRKAGLRHFYYGGKPGVTDQLAEKLIERFPGLEVAGTYCPPFRPLNAEECKDLKERVIEARPHIFWIGLSTPKQERFASEFLRELDATLFIAVGAAFDFHAGLVPQAPRLMQRAGLEWLYRLAKEPKRLWKRYLVNNPVFIWRISLQLLQLRKYHLPAPTRSSD